MGVELILNECSKNGLLRTWSG